MKKKLFILLMPLLLFGLTGCVLYNGQGKPSKSSAAPKSNSSEVVNSDSNNDSGKSNEGSEVSSVAPTSSVDPDALPKGTEVKVYLVFGEYGLYNKEPVTGKNETLFLEHVKELTAKVGDLLPTDKEVTSSVTNSKFLRWVAYNDDGNLTEYIKVPGYDNKILYAWFSGGNGGGVVSGDTGGNGQTAPSVPGEDTPPSTGDLPTTGYGFKFSDDKYIQAVHTNSFDGFEQYVINNKTFTQGQEFQLYNFEKKEGWVVSIDSYSFGGDSATSETWKQYILLDTQSFTYKVLQDFNIDSIYIKLKFGEDQIYFQLEA